MYYYSIVVTGSSLSVHIILTNLCRYIFLDALHSSVLFPPLMYLFVVFFLSWYTNELKSLVSLNNQAHAKYKSFFSDYRYFSLLHARFKFQSMQCYHDFTSYTLYPLPQFSLLLFLARPP